MSECEPQSSLQWREALLWLEKTDQDLAASRILIANNLVDAAAFHAQQALEKLLKAMLIAVAQDAPRIHDIEALAERARPQWPDLLPTPFPLAVIGQWYISSRYPGVDEAPPTAFEVADAVHSIAVLAAALKSRRPEQ